MKEYEEEAGAISLIKGLVLLTVLDFFFLSPLAVGEIGTAIERDKKSGANSVGLVFSYQLSSSLCIGFIGTCCFRSFS